MHGSNSYKVATRGVSAVADAFWDSNLGQTTNFIRFYFMCDSTPTVSGDLIVMNNHGATIAIGTLSLTTANKLVVKTNGGAAVYTFTNACTPGTWYRVELSVTVNGTTTAVWQVRLYQGDSATVTEDSGTQNVVNSGSPANADRVIFGNNAATTNRPTATGFIYFDDIAAFGTTWIGSSIQTIEGKSSNVLAMPVMQKAVAGWTYVSQKTGTSATAIAQKAVGTWAKVSGH